MLIDVFLSVVVYGLVRLACNPRLALALGAALVAIVTPVAFGLLVSQRPFGQITLDSRVLAVIVFSAVVVVIAFVTLEVTSATFRAEFGGRRARRRLPDTGESTSAPTRSPSPT